jgi:tetratricopeptide (TPR) repeat protein
MFKHLMEQPVAPRQINAQLPEHIEQTVLKALAKEREGRYADIASFINALRKSKKQWLHEARALYAAKRYEEALVAYEQAIRLDPNNVYFYTYKSGLLQRLGRGWGDSVC